MPGAAPVNRSLRRDGDTRAVFPLYDLRKAYMPPRKRAAPKEQTATKPVDTRTRFTAKALITRGVKKWGVYDRRTGSWPYRRAGFGEIAQDLATMEEAAAEAERLEHHYRKGSS